MTTNEVRIIGGMWRGRKLTFPHVEGLRPSLGRVRVTLFNWLNARIGRSRCLDLFAGSGALGLESLSRGASAVTLVEADRRAAAALRHTATVLGAGPACTIECMPAKRFLRATTTVWDIIYLDPPFDTPLLAESLALIHTVRCLAPDGVVYFEMPRRAAASFPDYAVLKESTAGDTRFGLLQGAGAMPAQNALR
jgi:16S rRNA (guanine966-N2)-methyltransferase